MNKVDSFLRQHRDIMEEVNFLEDTLSKGDYENYLGDFATHISMLAGKIKVHLSAEDKFLYPNLLESKSEELKTMAAEYIKEMGHISEAYTDYKNQFNTRSKIISNINVFVEQSKDIIKEIKNRIAKEERELYKLVVANSNTF